MSKEQIAQTILAKNPDAKEVHVTSDNFCFFEQHQADAHASRLADKKVESFTRKEAQPEAEAKAKAKAEAKPEAKAKPAPKPKQNLNK